MECWKDMGIQKRHSQFGDTKFMWRTVLLLILCVCCAGQESREELDPYFLNRTSELTELSGGVLTGGRTVWKADGSPYLLRDDLLVEREAELHIEPGVEVRFAPMIGITVRGKLLAVGHRDNKIRFTSTEERRSSKPFPDIRLVDGPSILAGRVQLLHRGQWRSVCTNSRNWTVNDMETACRQLGFMGGTFYNWMDRQAGRRARLLFEEPKCKGTEYDLFQCDWQSRQLGSGVCDYHPDLAIQCSPHHDDNEIRTYGIHWRGIRYENAVYERILTADNTLYVPTSMSRLAHITIKNAGLGRDNNATSALDIIGVPPVMDDIEISNSAFNAINVTSPNAPILLNNCTIQNNRGYGVYVNSTYGMTRIENCLIHDNGGDGVKYVVHEMNIDERFDRAEVFDLCTLASTPSQTFPIVMSLEQSRYSNMERDCHQKFYTRPDHVLTLSFIKLLTNKNDTGHIYVYDGLTTDDKLLMSFSIRNHSRPQSISSTRSRMYVRFHANTRTDITGFVRLTSGVSKTYDLNVTDSIISDNNGRGIAIENLRSQIHIHRTSISNNNHVAGLQVVNGAGDINVTESRISFNQGDGINVTVTGGNRNISRSIISSNQRYGIAVWINTTQETEYIPTNQTTVIEYSEIFKNLDVGILHGNFCGDSWVNVTGNWFNASVESTIDIATCWMHNDPFKILNLQIGHNRFYQNLRVPIKIQPALNVIGRIEYNYFEQGDYGAIVILNRVEGKYIEEFEILPAKFLIQHNYFFGNRGPFVVNLGLSPYSDIQYILFSRNYLRDNKIREQFESNDGTPQLTPRSRVAATIVLASSNIDVFRNIINNPEAQYEIGSHVEDQSKILNCTYNWLGFGEEEKVYNRLFHRKDRFNLAKIVYMPYLLHSSNPGATQINYNSLYVPQFNIPGSNVVGGEVEGIEVLRQGDYDVVKDINIRPGGKLILQSGVTLKFPPAIGMMVAGKLDAKGKRPNDITFTLKEEILMSNDTIYETDPEVDPTTPGYMEPVVPIRLLGGRTQYEGRLQVRLDGNWGTVCNYKWNIINAALVCNQLGLALNPDDWFLEPNEIPSAGMTEDIILSNVECTEFDDDITKCKAETVESFENSCTHENDVGIRCYETSWAGVRFSVLAERADLQYVTIEKAGLLDYSSNIFKPALQIDFSRHGLESVRIVNNYHDGLGILYSDLYGADAINTVRNSEFSENKGSGISFKQLGLKVYSSTIENNKIAGISHNPHITGPQQREIAGWFNLDASFNMDESSYRPIMIPEYQTDISLANGETRHIVFTKQFGENLLKTYNIKCNPGYVLGLQLLNPIHNFSTESICIYDSQNIHAGSTIWCLDRDLSTFPTTSNSFGVVLKYSSGVNALGGVVLVVSTIVAPVQNIRNKIIKGPVPTLQVSNTKIKGNTKGIKALYYNRYLNELGDHFLRKANETIKIINCEIAHNIEEAMYINTPFWDIHESNITEITLMINSSLITDNGKGIYHFARDLRSSNNLYHYVLQDNTIERNRYGGFDIGLPYVWQYNENFTHSVYMNNNTWRNNHNFGVVIDGHFAEVNLTKNVFTDNFCRAGLISIRGMEKKMKIDGNSIERNNGQYMVQFNMDSQSEIMGFVYAVFVYNQLKNNRFSMQTNRGTVMRTTDPTYVIGFKGIQKVKVSRNLFSNNALKYILVAGIKTAKINNLLDVTENWWGTSDEKEIRNLIFDFDDWNNHAIATYLPYLLEDSFDSSVSVTFSQESVVDVNTLGGRLTSDLTLDGRIAPYIVNADITVMPDVTLTINPGVILEFAPNVGILVMGTLNAIGHSQMPIFMKPLTLRNDIENRIEKREVGQYSSNYIKHRQQRQLETLIVQDSIRLCTGRNCSSSDNSLDRINEGFLEYYNKTTLQWVPMCDNRFTERNAQVVCRELGFDPINIFFAHDRRVEYHSNSLSRIWSWPEPLQCVGTESRYEDCPIRLNGQLYGHRHECRWDSDFIFIHCGSRNLDENLDYWGGIRFANPEFEYSLYEHRIHDHHTHETMKKVESTLRNIQIIGAGILHNEKSPAIQSIIRNPHIQNVNITKCAHHGINVVSPTDTINMMFNSVIDILGEGVNAISLTGEGRESEESSFTPLKDLNLPYHLFSLIDICDSTKVVTVEERVLLYYKYDNNPVNCVKIFKSTFRVKPFGFRLLQFNLFNHTMNYGKRDSITLYDGDIYNITAPQFGYLENGSPHEKKLFKTDGASLSVKLFANGASSVHGFIAEIVTLPISAIGLNRDVQHNISSSVFTNNRDGAISYQSVGEVNPFVAVIRNEFNDNCLKLYGNFTTCAAAVRVDVQNTQTLVFRNNLVRNNVGGLLVRADSRGSATSLRGWIHNNLFFGNHDLPCLQLEGRQSSPYQEVTIYRNYITRNRAQYKDVIVLRQVVSNFTHNYVHDNTGMRILEVSGFDKVRLPIYQTTSHNGFYKNYALDREGRATVVAGTAGQHYVDNIFFNPDNDYEMITVNRSIALDLWRTRIDAKHNYWSYNESLAVAGRIRDQSDNPMLLEVDYRPFYMNNLTVLGGGKCPPGWDAVAGTCYMYVGAPMTYEEARLFCLSDNASMPYVTGNYEALYEFIQRQNQWFQYGDRVWVNHIDYVTQCTSFAFTTVEITDCSQKNAFICEIDPKITIDPLSWQGDTLAVAFIGVLAAAVLLVILALICWYSKSKHRHLQRLERRNSIRQSLHSVRSIGSINGGFPDNTYRRKLAQMSTRSTDTLTKASDYKKMLASTTSMESMEKSQFNSSLEDTQSFDIYEAHNPNNIIQLKHSTFNKKPASPEYSVPQNVPINRPYNLAYRNEGYRDNSGATSGAPSMNTVTTEELPIIHHPGGLSPEDTLSPQSERDAYYTSDTLPLRGATDDPLAKKRELEREGKIYGYGAPNYESQPKLSFLMELRSRIPEETPQHSTTTFAQRTAGLKDPEPQKYYEEAPSPPVYSNYDYDSSPVTSQDIPYSPELHERSHSEAILETNFDFEDTPPMTEANRSHSQPLETAM